jgi:hypothetical protein
MTIDPSIHKSLRTIEKVLTGNVYTVFAQAYCRILTVCILCRRRYYVVRLQEIEKLLVKL